MIDIERQLSGGAVDEDAKETLATEEGMLPEQIYLLEKLMTWPTSLSLEAEWRRCSEAMNAVTAYCRVEEGGSRRGRKPKQLDQQAGLAGQRGSKRRVSFYIPLKRDTRALASGGKAGSIFSMFWKIKLVNLPAQKEI